MDVQWNGEFIMLQHSLEQDEPLAAGLEDTG
jgi:hypothetical protein